MTTTPPECNIPDNARFGIDGGHLLHAVVWPRSATYDEICEMYSRYVAKHYHTNATVIFDGYGGPPSTKQGQQNRRMAKASSADIVFTGSMQTTTTQEQFFGNKSNKSRLIQALSTHLRKMGIEVSQAVSDADVLIVSTILQLAESEHTVVLVGTDTDLMVMLVARAMSSASLFMFNPSTSNKPHKIFNINMIQQSVGDKVQNLLFLHAVTGCDTTSVLFRQGKKKAFKLLTEKGDLAMEVTVFNRATANHEDVSLAGENFLLALYGGTKFSTLDEYRYYAYKRTIASNSVSSTFHLATLPPTSAAPRQHSFRTYLQVQQWLGNELPPTEWGWQLLNNIFVPVPTDLPAAPEKLMKLISCKCKVGCMSRCGCRRAGMSCSAMCSPCIGLGCTNSPKTEDLEDDDVDLESSDT